MANNNLSQSPDATKGTVLGVMTATNAFVNKELENLLQAVSSPSPLTQNADIDKEISQLRVKLDSITVERGIAEIDASLKTMLQGEIFKHLSEEIERQINDKIEELVNKQVDEELNKLIPKALRDQVASQRQELTTVHCELHNSESCRANSLIKTQKQFNDPLHTIVNNKSVASPIFPENVNSLLGFSDEKVRELVLFYGLPPPLESRSANVNWFLRTCGVAYQYVNRK